MDHPRNQEEAPANAAGLEDYEGKEGE